MYWIDTDSGISRMKANNDDFLVTAKNLETLEILAQPMKDAWQITVTTLSQNEAIENFNGKTESGPPYSFQHVGLKITKLASNGLHLSNPKKHRKFTQRKWNGWSKFYECALCQKC